MGERWGYAASPSDGTRLFYSDDDRGDRRTPVVLCDGIGCDGYVWRYLRPSLTPRRTVHLHYRGHGRSQAPRDRNRVTIDDLADDVAAVLDDAEIDRAVLVGHSMGVQVALETWHRHRSRVAGLVLLCGAPGHPLRTFRGVRTLEDLLPTIERTIMRVPRMLNGISRALLPTKLAMAIAGRLEINRALVQPDDFMPYLEGMARMDVRVFVAILAAAGQHSAEPYLDGIDVPTLVVSGARDGFTPPGRSRDMATRIPGAELYEVEDGSHTAPIERPREIDDRIGEFLRRRVDEDS
ncbi:MAG TPA: alpha/beta hydrolase [Kofleriaceae bacterium]|jgi:pimeloyl-ACP methyl ester carboxylesterase|nr:alpha/beta hydrolase [Kofleriaceae bacterium]